MFVDCLYVSIRTEFETKNMLSTVSLPMIWMAARTSWDYGAANLKININGCRYLTS